MFNRSILHWKEVFTMSYRELAHSLIDQIPESKMYYIVTYLQGAAVPEETPNAETIAAMEELDNCWNIRYAGQWGGRKYLTSASQPNLKNKKACATAAHAFPSVYVIFHLSPP